MASHFKLPLTLSVAGLLAACGSSESSFDDARGQMKAAADKYARKEAEIDAQAYAAGWRAVRDVDLLEQNPAPTIAVASYRNNDAGTLMYIPSRLAMLVTSTPTGQPIVGLGSAEGEIPCEMPECSLRMRFGNYPSEWVRFRAQPSGRHTAIVAIDPQRILTRLKAADTVAVELNDPLGGKRQYQFKTTGFHFPKRG